MRRQLRVLVAAVAVLQPEILAQGTSPWVDAVANLSAATGLYREFWIIVPAGLFTLPGGINQTRATPEAWKWNHVPLPEP